MEHYYSYNRGIDKSDARYGYENRSKNRLKSTLDGKKYLKNSSSAPYLSNLEAPKYDGGRKESKYYNVSPSDNQKMSTNDSHY